MGISKDQGGGARRGAIGLAVVVFAAIVVGAVGMSLDWWSGDTAPDKQAQKTPAENPG